MTSEARASLIMMDATTLKNLLAEVKETVATGMLFPAAPKKTFGTATMWNIRRNAKSASNRINR
ncbi:MAG: hypothetical protein WDN26_12515 [Chitinophagaceae bacterium]